MFFSSDETKLYNWWYFFFILITKIHDRDKANLIGHVQGFNLQHLRKESGHDDVP